MELFFSGDLNFCPVIIYVPRQIINELTSITKVKIHYYAIMDLISFIIGQIMAAF